MSKKTQQVRAWKFLMEQVKNIQDPLLKRATIAGFRQRAIRDWGWDPVNGALSSEQIIDLDDWEEEFLQDIRDTQTFGFDVREEKRKKTDKEARARMRQFIRDGGTLLDLPENLRTPEIIDLFYTSLHEEGDELLDLCDYVTK